MYWQMAIKIKSMKSCQTCDVNGSKAIHCRLTGRVRSVLPYFINGDEDEIHM